MKKSTYIHIEEPCHENWSTMSPEEKGRFCHSCSKTVTDFSMMSDYQILKYLSTASGPVCGRFAPDQVNRSISRPATPAKKTIWAYLLSMFLPILASSNISAQRKSPATQNTEQHISGRPAKIPVYVPVTSGDIDDSTSLKKDTQKGKEDIERGEVVIKDAIMGLIVEYDKAKPADTVTTMVTRVTKNELFKVYPNPAVRGKKLSIQVTKAGRYTIQLLDAESKMIVYRSYEVTKGQIVFLDVPTGIAPGSYYLRLVTAAGKQFTDKLIVK